MSLWNSSSFQDFSQGTRVSETRVLYNSTFFFFLLFWVHVRLHPRGNGLELEFVKLKFQKQSNLLNYFIRMLYGKFFSKTLLANFAHIYICIFSTKLERNWYKHLRSNYSILYEDTFMSNINMSNMMTYNNLSECQD